MILRPRITGAGSYLTGNMGFDVSNDLAGEYVQVLAESSYLGNSHVYTYGAQRLWDETPTGTYGYLYDTAGSVRGVTQNGQVADTLRYDPYGRVLQGGDSLQPFYGYNGEEYHPGTGLQYLRARYYAPQRGAFLTEDTYGGEQLQPLTQNLYLHALGDPVNYKDPGGNAAASKLSGTLSAVKTTSITKTLTNQSKLTGVLYPVGSKEANKLTNISGGITKAAGPYAVLPSLTLKEHSLLPHKLDMHVLEVTSVMNRQFCSADAMKVRSEILSEQQKRSIAKQAMASVNSETINTIRTIWDVIRAFGPLVAAAIGLLAPAIPYLVVAAVVVGIAWLIWELIQNQRISNAKEKETGYVYDPIIGGYRPSTEVVVPEGEAISVGGVTYQCNVKAEEAVDTIKSQSGHFYPAWLSDNGFVYVSLTSVSREVAKLFLSKNEIKVGIMAKYASSAFSLCNELGGARGPEKHGTGEGWWPHYHAISYSHAHCWYLG